MTALADLLRYNTWASRRILEACTAVPPDRLREKVAGTYGSIHETLNHLVAVEHNYLRLLRGETPERPAVLELLQLREWLTALGDGYLALAEPGDASSLARTIHIPWLQLDLTGEQAVLQVVTHSVQHRAQVETALTHFEVAPPGLDFVWFVAPSPATAEGSARA